MPALPLPEPNPPREKPPLRWVRPPQQARSHQTLGRLLDAAEALVGERGFDGVTVAEITREARCSVGVFYSRFHDKAELLRCLAERLFAEVVATAGEALEPARWEGMDAAEVLTTLASFALQAHRGRERLHLAFCLGARSDEVLGARLFELEAELVQRIETLLAGRTDELSHPDLAAAARTVVNVVFDRLNTRALFVDLAGEWPVDEETEKELARVLVRYLGI